MRDVIERPAPLRGAFARHGEGTWIVPPCEVIGAESIALGEAIVILEHSCVRVLEPSAAVNPKLRIGDRVRLGRFLTIVCQTDIELADDVSSSDCVTIVDTWSDLSCTVDGPGGLPLPLGGRIRIETGAYLGYGCTIGPGVRVGEGAFVGEGAVVLHDVDAYTVVYGNPASVTRRFDSADQKWHGPEWP
jgi:acetyltransferase-like isoleucine patch superfamily enzyme